MCRQRSLFNK